MAKAPEPPKPTTWTIYKIAAKQTWVGTVEAAGEAAAIEKAKAYEALARLVDRILNPPTGDVAPLDEHRRRSAGG